MKVYLIRDPVAGEWVGEEGYIPSVFASKDAAIEYLKKDWSTYIDLPFCEEWTHKEGDYPIIEVDVK